MAEGVRQSRCAEVLGLSERTLQRWRRNNEEEPDGRTRAVRPAPANALSTEERAEILRTEGQQHHRRQARAPRACKPRPTHQVDVVNESETLKESALIDPTIPLTANDRKITNRNCTPICNCHTPASSVSINVLVGSGRRALILIL